MTSQFFFMKFGNLLLKIVPVSYNYLCIRQNTFCRVLLVVFFIITIGAG